MRMTKPLLGIFAVLGTWPNWESYFDLSRRGLKVSFGILTASLAPLWMIVYIVGCSIWFDGCRCPSVYAREWGFIRGLFWIARSGYSPRAESR